MNEWDDVKLHERLLAWEDHRPEEAAIQGVVNRLSGYLPQPEQTQELRRQDRGVALGFGAFVGATALGGMVLSLPTFLRAMGWVVAIACLLTVCLLPVWLTPRPQASQSHELQPRNKPS